MKHTIASEDGTGDKVEIVTPIIELPTTTGMQEMLTNNQVATELGEGVLVQNGLTTTQTHTKAATGEEVTTRYSLVLVVCYLIVNRKQLVLSDKMHRRPSAGCYHPDRLCTFARLKSRI